MLLAPESMKTICESKLQMASDPDQTFLDGNDRKLGPHPSQLSLCIYLWAAA